MDQGVTCVSRASAAGRRTKARPWPREHGAWAILLVSFGAGWAVGWKPDIRLLPLLVACVFALALRTDVVEAVTARRLRRLWPWGVSDGLVSLAALCTAAVGRPGLFGMAVLGMLAMSVDTAVRGGRIPRSLLAEVVSTGGLALAGPAALYTASGVLSGDVLWLWTALTVHFLGAVLRVRARLAQSKDASMGRRAWKAVLVYHLCAAAAAGAAGLLGWVPPAMWAAFVPALLSGLRERGQSGPLVLAKVGRRERNGSILFAVLLAAASRLR